MIEADVHALVDFEASGLPGATGLRLAFGAPLRVWQANRLDEVVPTLQRVQGEALAGHWCIGYVAYEAAPAFDPALSTHPTDGPLLWFGVHAAPLPSAGEAAPFLSADTVQAEWTEPADARERFNADLQAIQAAIEAGEVYQVNLSTRLRGTLREGQARALFHALRRAQPGGYAMWLRAGDREVLSLSPELFFDWDGERILLRPMKGTAPRDPDPRRDAERADALVRCTKERAENVMTVDLMRNDVSRIAEPHSVKVPKLFEPRALPTVWQMTSDVEARTRPGTTFVDVMQALFPCASVTGAPKASVMRQIVRRETDARGVYCGAVGLLRPHNGAVFNVAIRTVEAQGRALRLGVGSGITAGSRAAGEWREWRYKRGFVERASEPFALLETLGLDQGRPRHLDLHLARLMASARALGFAGDEVVLRAAIQACADAHAQGRWRLRLTLAEDGQVACEAYPQAPDPAQVVLALAPGPFAEAHALWVRHKTTRRAHYERASLDLPGVFDTLLWNDDGELTECTRGNIALRFEGEGWLTPALEGGLLAGIGRQITLAEGRVREAVIPVARLAQARELAFVNSLRGWLPARLHRA